MEDISNNKDFAKHSIQEAKEWKLYGKIEQTLFEVLSHRDEALHTHTHTYAQNTCHLWYTGNEWRCFDTNFNGNLSIAMDKKTQWKKN